MSTIHVKNIAHNTTEHEIREFFSFCGKIRSLSLTSVSNDPNSLQSATVTFDSPSAAKTALLLDNTQFGPNQVTVTAAASLDDLAAEKEKLGGEKPTHPENDSSGATTTEDSSSNAAAGVKIHQEDKPKSRILAEYLSHGYVLSDKIIEKGINFDKQHGVSQKFLKTLNDFDSVLHASDHAKAVDNKFSVSSKAHAGWKEMQSYFEKALETDTGRKIRNFYRDSNKQVQDVRSEARHLADLKLGKPTAVSTAPSPITSEPTIPSEKQA